MIDKLAIICYDKYSNKKTKLQKPGIKEYMFKFRNRGAQEPKIGIESDAAARKIRITPGRVATAAALSVVIAAGAAKNTGGPPDAERAATPTVPELSSGKLEPKFDDGVLPGDPNVPADQDKGSGVYTGHYDDGVLPGDPDVPADQDPGTPDVASDTPLEAGVSSPNVTGQDPDLSGNPILRPLENSATDNLGTVHGPAVVGVDMSAGESPVQIQGTDNHTGQGGMVHPDSIEP